MVRARQQTLLAVALAAGLTGCGETARYVNAPSPAQSVAVGAAITDRGVNVSPDHLGAGVVQLVVTNLTGSSQQLVVRAAGGSFVQETAPINPKDTAQLKAELGPGSYTVGVKDAHLPAATIAVGPRRPASRDQLLTP